ncbi:uncharacterized protein LOC135467064 [Liolophura sinensis]|uniref:uncharacterized protein LOC135467064 n=1 Tax=Liolophura sinensis TaxID=3198878 RepID=UPI0031583036
MLQREDKTVCKRPEEELKETNTPLLLPRCKLSASRHQQYAAEGAMPVLPALESGTADLGEAHWREVMGQTNPSGRYSFVSGVSEGKFYVATGQGRDKIFYNDIWVFKFRTERWEKLPGQPQPSFLSASEWNGVSQFAYSPQARYGAAGGIFPGSPHLYVSMGFSKQRYYDTVVYDVHQRSWHSEFPCYQCHPYSVTYPHARCLHSGVMVNSEELVIFGGCLTGGGVAGPCPSGDSWLFDGRSKLWTKLQDCVMPSMYAAMAMLPISTGERRVVLYGGINKTPQVLETVPTKENEIGLLNPGSGLWTRRKTLSSQDTYPSKRASVAMATGEEGVYMFGGFETEGCVII